MIRKWIKKYGYEVTLVDRRPFGEITIRFLEPKNIIGYIDTWCRTLFDKATGEYTCKIV